MTLGQQLLDLCASAGREVLLVAPFIKTNALKRVVHCISPAVSLVCVTRWRPEEVASGVSDLDVWPLVRDRGGRLLLRDNLHAKMYRADQRCLVGSANLTDAALGWRPDSNLELLLDTPPLPEFESELFDATIEVDDSIYRGFRAAVAGLTPVDDVPPAGGAGDWLPSLRNPEDLFLAYSGQARQLSSASAEAARRDLRHLHIPAGITGRERFEPLVGAALLQQPMSAAVDRYLAEPRRFGAVVDLLQRRLPERPRDEVETSWQTLMRWLCHFWPDRYEVLPSRHSEVLARRVHER